MAQAKEAQEGMTRCLFCDATKLTREHVWPDWIVRIFDKHVPRTKWAATLFNRPDGSTASWKNDSLTFTTRVVCKQCNEGWMSDVETFCKSIVHPLLVTPHPGVIDVQDQCSFAIWASLRSMVFDSLAPERKRYYSQSERVAFCLSDPFDPPADTHIWITQFIGMAQARFKVFTEISAAKDNGLHICTFTINKLAAALVTSKGPERKVPKISSRSADTFLQIWPTDGTGIEWPPLNHLTDETLDTFMNGFEDV